jgi:hypothetical protein
VKGDRWRKRTTREVSAVSEQTERTGRAQKRKEERGRRREKTHIFSASVIWETISLALSNALIHLESVYEADVR